MPTEVSSEANTQEVPSWPQEPRDEQAGSEAKKEGSAGEQDGQNSTHCLPQCTRNQQKPWSVQCKYDTCKECCQCNIFDDLVPACANGESMNFTQQQQETINSPSLADRYPVASPAPQPNIEVPEDLKSPLPEEEAQCVDNEDPTHAGCWPTMLIIGATKAGTSSLWRVLEGQGLVSGLSSKFCNDGKSSEEEIWNPPKFSTGFNDIGSGKEAHVLSATPREWEDILANKWRYYHCYRKTENPTRRFLDATPDYLSAPKASERLVDLWPHRMLPALRFVTVIREPHSRALSHYNALSGRSSSKFCSNKTGTPSFEDEAACEYGRTMRCFTKWSELRVDAKPDALPGDFSGTSAEVMHRIYHACADELNGQSMLLGGMYAPQIRSWHLPAQPKLLRSQMLVLEMEHLFDDPEAYMGLIGKFFGLARVNVKEMPPALPHAHSTVKTMSCASKKALETMFVPWNKLLFDDLRTDHAKGLTPPEEPKFDGFAAFDVTCLAGGASGTTSTSTSHSVTSSTTSSSTTSSVPVHEAPAAEQQQPQQREQQQQRQDAASVTEPTPQQQQQQQRQPQQVNPYSDVPKQQQHQQSSAVPAASEQAVPGTQQADYAAEPVASTAAPKVSSGSPYTGGGPPSTEKVSDQQAKETGAQQEIKSGTSEQQAMQQQAVVQDPKVKISTQGKEAPPQQQPSTTLPPPEELPRQEAEIQTQQAQEQEAGSPYVGDPETAPSSTEPSSTEPLPTRQQGAYDIATEPEPEEVTGSSQSSTGQQTSSKSAECKDTDPSCMTWAWNGECDSEYMRAKCCESCDLQTDQEHRRNLR